MTLTRRHVLGLLAALPLVKGAWAQGAWPNKPIRLIIPVPAGGQTDVVARMLGQHIGAALGQPIIVESKSGGNTIIATEAVARSPADGYTLLLNLTVLVQNPLLMAKVPYDPVKDFVPVSRLYASTAFFAVHADVPAKSVGEFVAYAKKAAKPLSYGTNGHGSTAHMYAAMFASMAGIELLHVPYKGEAPMIPDLVKGRIEGGYMSGMTANQLAKEGKIRVLATTGRRRLTGLPTVPTFEEQGYPGLDADGWVGVFAPAGTPQSIVDRLATEFDRAIAQPDVRERIISYGLEPAGGTAAEFAAVVRRSINEWGRIIKTTNIKLD